MGIYVSVATLGEWFNGKLKGWNSMWGRKARMIEELQCENKRLMSKAIEFDKMVVDRFKEDMGKQEFVECETCGCAVFKGSAVKGKGEIRNRKSVEGGPHVYWSVNSEYIHHPYYCKAHDPNKVKEPLCGKTKKAGNK